MYSENGEKIKNYATFFTIIEILASIIYGVVLLFGGLVGLGLVVIVGGIVFACATNCVLCGFGELVENSAVVVHEMQKKNTDNHTEKTIKDSDEWKCAACGRVNKKYVSTCSCGKSKYE